MEKYIRYKRFAETHNERTLQDFYDRLITEGWEIIYYNEIRQPTGQLSATPQEINIHVIALCGKKQDDTLSKPVVL
jgi:hypothetical protein